MSCQRSLALCFLLTCWGLALPSAVEACSCEQKLLSPEVLDAWSAVLDCGLRATEECKTLVLKTSERDSAPEALSELARVTLEEWGGADPASHQVPRLVYRPTVDKSVLDGLLPARAVASSLVMEVEIDDRGMVKGVTLVRATRYPAMNQLALQLAPCMRFRPARGPEGYRSGKLVMSSALRVH